MWMIHIFSDGEIFFYWRWRNLATSDSSGVEDGVVSREAELRLTIIYYLFFQNTADRHHTTTPITPPPPPPITALNWGSPAWAELLPSFQIVLCGSVWSGCHDYRDHPSCTLPWSLRTVLIMIGAEAPAGVCACATPRSWLWVPPAFLALACLALTIICSTWHVCPVWSPHLLIVIVNWWKTVFKTQQRGITRKY